MSRQLNSVRITGYIKGNQPIRGRIQGKQPITGTIQVAKTKKLPEYEGPYEVVPVFNEQILETKQKSMADDVTVLAIPIYEVSNPQGGTTVTIGGI